MLRQAGASPLVKAAQDEQRPEEVVDTIGGAAAMVSEMKLPKASCLLELSLIDVGSELGFPWSAIRYGESAASCSLKAVKLNY